MRSLGVTCSNKVAHFTLTENGEVLDCEVEKLDVAAQYESTRELEATLEDAGRVLAGLRPDRVSILLPEQSPRFKRTYAEWMPRVALETLLRLACVRASIPVELVARPTVRARLGLPQAKDLASHVSQCVAEPVGKHWNAGRNIAALAALAGEAV